MRPNDRARRAEQLSAGWLSEGLARMPDPTTVFLVRHGQTDWIARGIAGRLPDVHLNADGRGQAAHLVTRMRHLPRRAIYSARPNGARSGSTTTALQILGVNDTGDLYA